MTGVSCFWLQYREMFGYSVGRSMGYNPRFNININLILIRTVGCARCTIVWCRFQCKSLGYAALTTRYNHSFSKPCVCSKFATISGAWNAPYGFSLIVECSVDDNPRKPLEIILSFLFISCYSPNTLERKLNFDFIV